MPRIILSFSAGVALGAILMLLILTTHQDCRVVTSGDPADPTLTAMVKDQGWILKQIAVYPTGYADWHICH